MTRRLGQGVAATAIAAFSALLLLPTLAAATPAAGPQIAKCGKFKKKAAKKRCQKQNQANRIVFNQVKNSKFVGERGDGQSLEDVYCANGKWESRATDSYGTGVSTGKRWRIANARVRNGGKWVNAFLTGQGGFEIALQRRGKQWKIGVASLGRILYPGNVDKTNASKECATLSV